AHLSRCVRHGRSSNQKCDECRHQCPGALHGFFSLLTARVLHHDSDSAFVLEAHETRREKWDPSDQGVDDTIVWIGRAPPRGAGSPMGLIDRRGRAADPMTASNKKARPSSREAGQENGTPTRSYRVIDAVSRYQNDKRTPICPVLVEATPVIWPK